MTMGQKRQRLVAADDVDIICNADTPAKSAGKKRRLAEAATDGVDIAVADINLEKKKKKSKVVPNGVPDGTADTCVATNGANKSDGKDANAIEKSGSDNMSAKQKLSNSRKSEADENESNLGDFPLSKVSLACLEASGIKSLFEIQVRTFSIIYEGKDVIARSKTGTGKTFAFALPVVERLFGKQNNGTKQLSSRNTSIICILPTRELAQQVGAEFDKLRGTPLRFSTVCVYGGAPEGLQIQQINRSTPDLVVGTPGRLLDFLNREILDISKVSVVILDEADQMLKMGFKEDIDAILAFVADYSDAAAPKTATKTTAIQYLLFSATLPSWIFEVADRFMSTSRIKIDLVRENQQTKNSAAEGVQHLVISCPFHERAGILDRVVAMYTSPSNGRALVFVDTKSMANEIAMNSSLSHMSQVIHGDIQQQQREITLKAFKDGRFKCLIATDVAARGIHIDDVDLVVQLSVPKDKESYIHRAGRTGRAGRQGFCIVFCGTKDQSFLNQLTIRSGIKFKRIGIPQPATIVSSAAKVAISKILETKSSESNNNGEGLEDGKSKVVKCFTDDAQALLNACDGPVEAISRCLAELTNYAKVSQFPLRSAVTGRDNLKAFQITMTMSNDAKVGFLPSAKYLLQKFVKCDANTTSNVCTVIPLKDKSGFCFDVPSSVLEDFEQKVKELPKDSQVTLKEVSDLPELEDRGILHGDANSDNNSYGGYNKGYGGYNKFDNWREKRFGSDNNTRGGGGGFAYRRGSDGGGGRGNFGNGRGGRGSMANGRGGRGGMRSYEH